AVQWLLVARPGRVRPAALELGPATSPAPYELDLEDPLGSVRRCLDGGSAFAATLPNAVSAETVAALFDGNVVFGPSRSSLAAGITAAALRERFEGSGLSTEVSHASPIRISSSLAAVVDEARALGLPVDVDALQASSVCLKARRGPA
ncbi:MAG TPA: hypothetical protein VGR00_06180, partial [Thermoanaerobaculia bacterium]|nr:hypothetical protein [Thermoanaerobaculia bacterium]